MPNQLPPNTTGLILDMDGVLWRDAEPIGDLPRIFAHLQERGIAVILATNNSTRTVEQYQQKLAGLGVQVQPWQVVTSSHAVAELVASQLPQGAPVFVIGESGVLEAVAGKGLVVLPLEQAKDAEAVIFGIDRKISFEKMSEANLLIRAGKPFFATNPDKTFPTPRGEIPGAGAWLATLITGSGVEPTFAGKPHPFMLEMALQRLGTPRQSTWVVGDRLETDIAGGQAIGCPVALVLSGVSTLAQAQAWSPSIDRIATNLTELTGA